MQRIARSKRVYHFFRDAAGQDNKQIRINSLLGSISRTSGLLAHAVHGLTARIHLQLRPASAHAEQKSELEKARASARW